MAQIIDLSDELLVKILSFLPTKVAVSTSILSKQWKFLWMWCPDLDLDCNEDSVKEFIDRNLPLYNSPFINSLCLSFGEYSIQPETFKSWVETAVSRWVRHLTISSFYYDIDDPVDLSFPSSLYACNSLVTLELKGRLILLEVPQKACLPSLKKLHISEVTYSNEENLRLLLYCCPVLEDLLINRGIYDNLQALVIKVPSLQRLSLIIDAGCWYDDGEYVIVTPSLKYIKIRDERFDCSYTIEHMPELEEADISLPERSNWKDLLKSISNVRCLSLVVTVDGGKQALCDDGIVFSNLEVLKLCILSDNWSMITFQLLRDSPNLQVLGFDFDYLSYRRSNDEPVGWINNQSLVPECLLSSLKTLEFTGYTEKEKEEEFLCYIIKHACCLESYSID